MVVFIEEHRVEENDMIRLTTRDLIELQGEFAEGSEMYRRVAAWIDYSERMGD